MKILIDDKIEEIILVPHVSRNTQRKHSELLLQKENKLSVLRKEFKDVTQLFNVDVLDQDLYLKAKSKNKEIDNRLIEFTNLVHDIQSENDYKSVIYSTNRNWLSDKIKAYFVDFDNLSNSPDSQNYSKLSREEILEFWDNQDKIEIENYINSFRRFIQ